MFLWYQSSIICYAFLSDVNTQSHDSTLASSRWFKRGWTLQELLAPSKVIFYDSSWNILGSRLDLAGKLARITSIDESALGFNRPNLNTFCVARRMAWASDRQTTRVEDEAYSLLGLFDINMPLLYGEGTRAFLRLQEEIIKKTNDDSIFAWGLRSSRRSFDKTQSGTRPSSTEISQLLHEALQDFVLGGNPSIFAKSPQDFEGCHSLSYNASAGSAFNLTNIGLKLALPCVPMPPAKRYRLSIGMLNCSLDSQPEFVGILLAQVGVDATEYETEHVRFVAVAVSPRLAITTSPKQLTIVQKEPHINTGSKAHVATRGRRILVTLSPEFVEAGLRIAHAEGVVVRHFTNQTTFTSDWDPDARLLFVDCSAVTAVLLQFQLESWDKRPASKCTLFTRTAMSGFVLEQGTSFTNEKMRSIYQQLGLRADEEQTLDSNLVDRYGAKLRMLVSLQEKKLHHWRLHEMSIDVKTSRSR